MIEILPINQNDIAEIAEIEADTFSDPWSYDMLFNSFNTKAYKILGAYENGLLFGYITALFMPGEAEILRFAVINHMRKCGIGGKLINGFFKLCLEYGTETALLEVRSKNAVAISFYEKYGFIRYCIRPKYYENPTDDAVLMKKVMNWS